MKTKNSITLSILLLLFNINLFSQKENDSVVLFNHDDLIDITISGDIKNIYKNMKDDKNYHEVLFEYIDKDTIGLSAKVKPRGNFRRTKGVCSFPPLFVKFKKKEIKNTIFEGLKKIKLVTHCYKKSEKASERVVLEYLAYKLYNIITPESFKARLAKIKYFDINKAEVLFESYAIFLEPKKELSKRLKKTIWGSKGINHKQCYYHKVTKLAIFHFMIGNTDWGISSLHNTILMRKKGCPFIPIPYDFDFSYLVNSPYASHPEKFEMHSLSQRKYMGIIRQLEDYKRLFKVFLEKKTEFYAVINKCKLISDKHKKRINKYFDTFYKIINNDRKVKSYFIYNALKASVRGF